MSKEPLAFLFGAMMALLFGICATCVGFSTNPYRDAQSRRRRLSGTGMLVLDYQASLGEAYGGI